jgi:hypothetical protein
MLGDDLHDDIVDHIADFNGSEMTWGGGFFSFGMRVRKVSLRSYRTYSYFMESSMISQTSSPMISQQWWMKSTVNPSGPKAFPSGVSLRA